MRSDLLEATEKVRRLEAEKEQLDTDTAALKQQVGRGCGRMGDVSPTALFGRCGSGCR